MPFKSPLTPILEAYNAALADGRRDDLLPLMDQAAAIRMQSKADIRDKLGMLANHGSHAGYDLSSRYLAWSNNVADLDGLRAYETYAKERLADGWDAAARLAISIAEDSLALGIACFEAGQNRGRLS